jgi:hypothetical protein
MPGPFPGMDPYLERRDLWPDVHQSLITYSRDALQPQIRPRYHARIGERLYVIPPHRSIYPDVTVTQHPLAEAPGEGRDMAVLTADAPVVIAVAPEEVREPFIEILDLTRGGRVVTVIETLSPANKNAWRRARSVSPQAGRDARQRHPSGGDRPVAPGTAHGGDSAALSDPLSTVALRHLHQPGGAPRAVRGVCAHDPAAPAADCHSAAPAGPGRRLRRAGGVGALLRARRLQRPDRLSSRSRRRAARRRGRLGGCTSAPAGASPVARDDSWSRTEQQETVRRRVPPSIFTVPRATRSKWRCR